MLLGYNTNGLQNHRLEDALRLLADYDYQAVGLTLDVGHLDPFRCTSVEVGEVAALLDRLGLAVSIETGGRFVLDRAHKHEPTLMTRDVQARERRLAFYERAAIIGRDLGAKVLSFWAGVDRAVGPDSHSWLVEGVVETCRRVRRSGLEPAFEPEPGMAVETVAEFHDLVGAVEAMGEPGPGLCLDVGHLYVTGEGDPAEILTSLRPGALAQVHLEDMRRGIHEHLPPGEGDVDFAGALQALRDHEYAGPVCFELSRHSHMAPTVLECCRSVWNTG